MFRYNIIKKNETVNLYRILRSAVFAYGLHAIAVYRFGRWIEVRLSGPFKILIKGPLMLIYQMLACMVRKAYGISISKKADIGPGLYIGHFGGIKIERCTVIGANCSIQQHTKILSGKNTGRPSYVGSQVWVGAYAVIEGCTIGDGATIAAAARVEKNIDCCTLAMGNPARVVIKPYNNIEILGAIA